MICGIDVTLYEVTQDGVDDFNKPILEEIPVTVPNVVVAPASSTDILSTTQIYGKSSVSALYPKGRYAPMGRQNCLVYGRQRLL